MMFHDREQNCFDFVARPILNCNSFSLRVSRPFLAPANILPYLHNQTWLDPTTPPPGDFAKCKVCNNPMLMLLQLNGDLPEHFPNDERWLYIFGCPRRACSRKHGSMRALRGVKKHKISNYSTGQPQQKTAAEKTSSSSGTKDDEPQKPKQDIGASLFGVGSSAAFGGPSANANPFSTPTSSSCSTTESNPFAPLPTPSTQTQSSPQKPKAQSSEEETEKLPESFADKVRVSSPPPQSSPSQPTGPPTPWPEQSAFPSPYPQYYLDAEYETLSSPSTPTVPTSAQTSTMEAEYDGGGKGGASGSKSGSSAAAESKDSFESSLDKVFQRFSTRLGHNPEQVLRYEFRGTPLLYSTTDAVGKVFPYSQSPSSSNTSPHIKTTTAVKGAGSGSGTTKIPRCESCGRERVFEVQLAPHAITVLEDGREDIGAGAKDETGMEWGTVILGVCAGNCGLETEGLVGWREEWVGVQWEERTG